MKNRQDWTYVVVALVAMLFSVVHSLWVAPPDAGWAGQGGSVWSAWP